MVYGYLNTTMAELNSFEREHGLKYLKYLLSGHYRKVWPMPCLDLSDEENVNNANETQKHGFFVFLVAVTL